MNIIWYKTFFVVFVCSLSNSTSEEKEQWVTALQAAIEDNTKKHHTFQAVKQAPQVL